MISNPLRQVVGTTAVAALGALSWYAWMGWDTTYQTDPVTGERSGPYEAWQVLGCVASLLVVLVGAVLLRVHPVPASVALTLAFTVAWTITATSRDVSGTSGVGTMLVLFGLSMGTAVVSAVTVALRRRLARRDHPA